MSIIIISILVTVFILQIMIYFSLAKLKKQVFEAQEPDTDFAKTDSEEYSEEVKRTVELQLLRMRNAVQKQCEGIHKKEIELAPAELVFNDETLMNVFSETQISFIKRFTDKYKRYLRENWYTHNGKIKTVFRGSVSDKNSEAGQVSAKAHELCFELDALLHSLMKD